MQILFVGLAEYVWLEDVGCVLSSKFTDGRVTDVPKKVFKSKMPPYLKL